MTDLTCAECGMTLGPWFFRESFPNPDAAFCGLHRPPQRRWSRFMFRCQRCGTEVPAESTIVPRPGPQYLFERRIKRPAPRGDFRRRYCVGGCR